MENSKVINSFMGKWLKEPEDHFHNGDLKTLAIEAETIMVRYDFSGKECNNLGYKISKILNTYEQEYFIEDYSPVSLDYGRYRDFQKGIIGNYFQESFVEGHQSKSIDQDSIFKRISSFLTLGNSDPRMN